MPSDHTNCDCKAALRFSIEQSQAVAAARARAAKRNGVPPPWLDAKEYLATRPKLTKSQKAELWRWG